MNNLNHLYHFYVIAQMRGLTRARDQLHVTQATLSYSLKRLEEDLETSLITRGGKKFELTGAGQKLFETCDHIFTQLRKTTESLKVTEDPLEGYFRLGSQLMFGTHWLSGQMGVLNQYFQKLKFIINLASLDILDDLRSGKTDLSIVSEEFIQTGEKELVLEPAVPVKLGLFASTEYLKNFKPVNNYKMLKEMTLVDWEPHLSFFNYVETSFAKKQLKFAGQVSINNTIGIKHAIEAGVGVGILPVYVTKDLVRAGHLTQLMPQSVHGVIRLQFVYHSRLKNSNRLQKVKSKIAELLKGDFNS